MADYSLGTAHGQIKIDADTSGIDQTEKALGGLNKSAQSTEQAMDKTANATGIAGAAIAGGLGLAVKTAMDFDFQLSAIQSVSGATAAEMDKIRDAALRIGTDTKFSATEAASAMEELAKAGVSTEDILGGVADATVALAAATGTDMANAATIASDTMNMFGLKASDMDGIVNTLAQTANASSIGIDDLGMAFSQVGAVANLAGLDVAETASAIGQLGDAGIKGSDAGTSLKTMLMNLQPSTKAQATAMKELGLITEDGTNRFYNANGELKSLREVQEILQSSTEHLTDAQKQMALETIFGSDAIRAAAVMADNGAEGFDAFAKKQAETGTAAEQAKIRQDNLKGSIEQLMGSVETLAISVGSALTPMIRWLADSLGVVVAWFNQLTPTQQQWVVGILAGAAALLLLTAGILKAVMMFRSMILTMQTLRILSTATSASFISMAATGIASFVRMAASAVSSAATATGAWLAHAGRMAALWAAQAAAATAHALRVAAAWLLTAGANAAIAVAQTAAAVASMVAGWVVLGVQSLIQAARVALAWFIALGPIGWAIAALIAVIAFVIIFWDEIVAFFKAGAEKVSQWLQTAWDWVVEKWNGIVAAFRAAGQAVANAIETMRQWVVNKWNELLNFFRQIPGWIMGVFAAAGSWLIGAGQNIINGLRNGAVAIWNGFIGWLGNLGSWVMGIFSGAGGWLINAGRNLIQGLWNGVSGMFGWVMGKIRGFASSIVNGIKGFFGIGSPSKVFADEIGKWLPPGIAVGIEANAREAIDAAKALADGVTASVAMSPGGSDAFWDGTALGRGYVPPSNEVTSYAASGDADAASTQKIVNFNTYNPVAERASDSEARRLRALSALGAF